MREFYLRNYLKGTLLAFFILCILNSFSQNRRQLSVGDKIPNVLLKKIINHSRSNASLADFKGKAILLDFWAPWCSPCLAVLPKLDSFQKRYSNEFQLLLVTKEGKDYSQKSLDNLQQVKGIQPIVSVVEDSILIKLFGHRVIPHYVWIDNNGIVKAISGSTEVTEDNIQRLIHGNDLPKIPIKKDNRNYDYTRPFFASRQIPIADEMMYQSVLTKYIQNAPGGSGFGKNWIHCSNHPIALLFKIAFGEFDVSFISNKKLVLEGFEFKMDSVEIGIYNKLDKPIWKEVKYDNLYSYELVVPSSTFSKRQMFEIMQADLNRMFASRKLQGRREKRKVKILELVRSSELDKIKSFGGDPLDDYSTYYLRLRNMPISSFIVKLQAFFSNDSKLPITDNTGYLGNVDIELNANLTKISSINSALEKYDLKLIESEKEIDVIVIKKIK